MSDLFIILFVGFDYYLFYWFWGLFVVLFFFLFYDGYVGKKQNFLWFLQLQEKQDVLVSDNVKYYVWGICGGFVFVFCCFIGVLVKLYNMFVDLFEIDYKNGIDIIFVIDILGFMLVQDFELNWLEVVKKVVQEFVDYRKGDCIGLVLYEGEVFIVCFVMFDYLMLKEKIVFVQVGMMMMGGMVIGDGLGIVVMCLWSDSIKLKVIIFFIDGSNNVGSIILEEVVQLVVVKYCIVYIIGVGSDGMVFMFVLILSGIFYQSMFVDIDESILKYIVMIMNGKYFWVIDENSLKFIYLEIDQLEKWKMEDLYFVKEFLVFIVFYLFWGFIFLVVVWIV